MSQANVEIFRAYHEEIIRANKEDLDTESTIAAMAEFWDPEVEYDMSESPWLDLGGVYRGLPARRVPRKPRVIIERVCGLAGAPYRTGLRPIVTRYFIGALKEPSRASLRTESSSIIRGRISCHFPTADRKRRASTRGPKFSSKNST
jgi:hypothetical protein